MRYAVPVVSHWKGTVVAVNVGGAVIPTLMSIYLLVKRDLWVKGLVATAIVALVIHWIAEPIPGLGIAVPVFMPVLVTAIVAVILSRQDSAMNPNRFHFSVSRFAPLNVELFRHVVNAGSS